MLKLLKKLLQKEESRKSHFCAYPWHYKSDGKFIKKAVLVK